MKPRMQVVHDDPPEPIAGVFTELARATSTPPVWIIKDLIAAGLNIIAGPPKSLKSTLLLAISLRVSGHETNLLPPEFECINGGSVMGFAYEQSVGELLHIAEEGLGQIVRDDASIIIADDPWEFQLDDENGVRTLLFWLKEKKPRVCWFDPFAEAHSLEEKDSRAMISLLRPLHRWGKANDCAIILAHHTRKKAGEESSSPYTTSDIRGSSAIFGKMDGVLIITPHEDSPGLLSIRATFKRGKSWARDLQFAAYGETGEVKSAEVIDDIARMTLSLIKAGVRDHLSMSRQLGIGKKRLGTAIDALVRTGKVSRVGRKLKVMKSRPQKSSQRRIK